MDYLEQYDKFKKEYCEELSPELKLRTGYKSKKKLKQGLETFVANVKGASLDEKVLMKALFPEVAVGKINLGYKLSSGDEQPVAVIDYGFDDNSVSGYTEFETDPDEYPSPYYESDYSVGIPASVLDPDEEQQRRNEIIEMYQNDEITENQLMNMLREIRGYEADAESIFYETWYPPNNEVGLPLYDSSANPRGGRRTGAGRYSRRDREDARRENMPPRDIRAVNQALEGAIEYAIDEEILDTD